MRFLLPIFLILGGSAWAGELPANLLASITSENAKGSSPAEINFSSIEFQASGVSGISVTAVPGSLEWVRINDVLAFPRIWIHVSFDGAASGMVLYAGASHPFVIKDGKPGVDLPIALISNPENHFDVQLQESHSAASASYTVKYSLSDVGSHVFVDPSCLRFKVQPESVKLSSSEWVYVGCRHETSLKEGVGKSSVVLSVFWNSSSGLSLDDVPVKSSSQFVYSIRLNEAPGVIRLRSGDSAVAIDYQFSDRFYRASFWMGLGPYHYGFWGGSDSVTDTIALATLYGSYFLDDTSRVIVFDATDLNDRPNTDFGVYYSFENARALDRRVAFNLMLGVHAIGIKTMGSYFVNFGLPQGIELVFHDLFLPLYNLSAGAFLYPSINGTSYNNVWLRYGTTQFFGEVNYISFQETIQNTGYFSRSLGISLGFPLGHAF